MLLETVRIENGVPCHLAWHEARMARSTRAVLGKAIRFDLHAHIVPPRNAESLMRCRILYGETIRSVTFHPYEIHSPRRLLTVASNLSYAHKFADRYALEQLFAERGEFDDVLIVQRGFVTDTTRSNIAFFDGSAWLTPDTPLLHGTTRARLITGGSLKERPIALADISRFEAFALMNAMIGFRRIENGIIETDEVLFT